MSFENSKSRFISLQIEHKPARYKDGKLKNGQEIKIIKQNQNKNMFVLLNWKDGFLHSTQDIPAVQMDDGHTEFWTNGYLNNDNHDSEGNLMPAVITNYGTEEEFWINGKRLAK